MMAEEIRDAKLRLGVETKGVDKSVNALKGIDREIDQLTKDIRQNFDKSVNSVEALTDEIRGDLLSAIKEADKAAEGINIKPGSPAGSAGSGSVPAAAKFRGAASLIGGGEIIGLIDDLQDLGEGLGQLSGGLGSSAKAALTAGAAFGVATAAIAVIGAAMKSFADEQQKAADTINAIVDQQRSVGQQVAGGATSSDLQARLTELNALREDETQRLAELKSNYDANVNSAGILTPVVKALSGAEEGLAGQISKSEQLAQSYEAEIKAINDALASGKTSANDAKAATETVQQAEIQLAETRSGVSVESTREAAKAEREAERAEAERLRSQEQAQREAEQNAQRAADAQTKYNDAVRNAGENLKQAAQDINTKTAQGEFDIRIRQGRDLDALQLKNTQDITKLIKEDWRSARDEAFKNADEIEDIRREGRSSELEAIQEGDFKQLFLAREALKNRLEEEKRTDDREKRDRERALTDRQEDLKVSLQEETRARRVESFRQLEDLRLNAQRELQQVQTARTRSLEAAAQAYRAELAQLSQYLQARNQLQTQANQQALQQMGIPGRGISGAGIGGAGISGQGIPARMLGQIIR